MPTVMREGPYRFFFYAGDRGEPPHVHVERDDQVAKFWLDPIRLCTSGGCSRSDVSEMQKIINRKREQLLQSWHDYFNA